MAFKPGAAIPFTVERAAERGRDRVQLLSEYILEELASVEGRYIEWEWDPRTLSDDFLVMREPDGLQVKADKNRLKVHRRALEELVHEQLVAEDPSRRTKGFRLYRLTAEGRKRAGR